jgi:hypothetical protein
MTNIINKGDKFGSGWDNLEGMVEVEFEAVKTYSLDTKKDKLMQMRLVRHRIWLDEGHCGSGDDMCRCEKCEIVTTYVPRKRNQPNPVGRIFMAKFSNTYEEDGDIWMNLDVQCFNNGSCTAQRLVKKSTKNP